MKIRLLPAVSTGSEQFRFFDVGFCFCQFPLLENLLFYSRKSLYTSRITDSVPSDADTSELFAKGSSTKTRVSSFGTSLAISWDMGIRERGLGARMIGIDTGEVCATSDNDPFCVGDELRLPARDGNGGCNMTQT